MAGLTSKPPATWTAWNRNIYKSDAWCSIMCFCVENVWVFISKHQPDSALGLTALSRLPHIRQELKCLRDNSSQIILIQEVRPPHPKLSEKSFYRNSTVKLFSPTYWKIQGIQFKVWGMLQFVSPLATWITIPQLLDWWTFRISSEFRMSIARMLVLSCTSCPKKTCTFIFHASSTSCLSKMVYLILYLCCYFGVL